MRIRDKTMLDRMNAEPAEKVLADLEAKHGSAQRVVRLIVCAAIRSKQTRRVICGARHLDEIMRDQIMRSGGRVDWIGAEQGFIDQFCVFLNRREAWEVAKAAGQIRNFGWDEGFLYSENLY